MPSSLLNRTAKSVEKHIARISKAKLAKAMPAKAAAPRLRRVALKPAVPAPVSVRGPSVPRYTSGLSSLKAAKVIVGTTHIPRPDFTVPRPVPARKSAMKSQLTLKKAKKTVSFVGNADETISEVGIIDELPGHRVQDRKVKGGVFATRYLVDRNTPHRREPSTLFQRDDESIYQVQYTGQYDDPSREGVYGLHCEFRTDAGKCPYCLQVRNTIRFLPNLDFLDEDPDEYAMRTECLQQASTMLACLECEEEIF